MVFWLSLIFLFLLPFLDGGTSFLAEILILTLPLPLFLIGLSRKEFDFHNLRPSIIFSWLIFLGFVLLSVLTSASLIFSLPAFFQTLAIFLFFLLFSLTAREENLPISLGLVLLVALSLSLVSFYFLLPWVAKPAVGMNLIYASYGHNHLADVLLLAIPLALALFLQAKERSRELLLSLLILLYIVALGLTFSRGAFLVLPLVVLFLFFWLKPKLASRKILTWLLILLPIGVICLIGIFSLSQTGLEAKLATPGNWLVKQLIKPEFQAKRLEYWREALQAFALKPLTGFGWGTFELVALRFQKETVGWSSFTHNFYLQVLAEAGLFAFLAFLSFLFLAIRQIWLTVKRSRGEPFLVGSLAAILASSLHSFLDFDWHFPAVFLLFLWIVAVLMERTTDGGALRSPTKFLCGTKNMPFRSSKICRLPARLSIILLVFLSISTFLFGQLEVISEYFEQKGDFKTALQLSPWPAVRVRQLGDKTFASNFAKGEETAQRIIAFSPGDPSMNSWLAQKYEQHGELAKAANYYQKALEFNPLGNFYLYPRAGRIYFQLGQTEERDRLYQFFAQNLAKVKIEKEDKGLAKTLYQIGLDYLKEGSEEKALFWWQKAPAWAPWWSYFYIEAASLEMKIGDKEAAKVVLDKCLTYDFPRVHCQEYENRLVKGKNFEAPGFWQANIEKMFDY